MSTHLPPQVKDDPSSQDLSPQRLIAETVLMELESAMTKFPPFNSGHEGLAVIYEEFFELQVQIFKRRQDMNKVRLEAIQLAAMAIRLVHDVCDRNLFTDHDFDGDHI